MKPKKIRLFILSILLLLSACDKNSPVQQGFVEGQFIYLSSSVSGYLKKLDIYRGNFVKAGQILFSLTPEPENYALIEAKSRLMEEQANLDNILHGERTTILQSLEAKRSQAKADLMYAKTTLDRYQRLHRKHVASQDEVDLALSTYNIKKQLLNQYDADLREARLGKRKQLISAQRAKVNEALETVKRRTWSLKQKQIAAPQNGQIFDTFYKEGEYVKSGSPVTALLTPDNIKVIFYLPEKNLSQIKLKQTIIFQCDGCEKSKAIITYISPEAEYTPPVIYSQKTRSQLVYRIECTMAPKIAVKFHPGQPVDVYLN